MAKGVIEIYNMHNEFVIFTLRSSFSALKFTVPSEDCPVMLRAAPFTDAIRPLVSNTSPRPLMTRTICTRKGYHV